MRNVGVKASPTKIRYYVFTNVNEFNILVRDSNS